MPTFRLDPRSVRAVLLAGATSLALVATLATPARASEPAAGAASAAAVGDFALGDGVEGLIDDQTGALSVGFPVAGGASLEWDSRDAGVDRFGLGDGWRWRGIGFISVEGGVRVFPASGGQYEMDASSPTGLAGYAARDVAFARADDGELLAERADGRVAAQPYRFVLAELGGRRTYFRDDGVPVAMVDLHGNRTDFAWDDDRRLTRMVDELGVRTELTWQHGSVSVLASARTDQADAVTATVQLGSTGPLAVIDAVDRRTGLVYDPASELLARIDGSSGAVTQVTWQALVDGTTAVERVSVSDGETGPELSGRSWQASVGAASGWPVVSAPDAVAGAGYETAVSDGVSTTRSVYTAERRLTGRALEVTTPSGAVVVQEQQLEYADGVPGTRPISAELVVTDTAGGARAEANRFEYDDLGRPLEEIGADGAVTAWTYDEVERHVEPLPGGIQPPPAGLVVGERRTAADGLITETRDELDATGRSVVASEAFAGRTGEPLTRTGRVEYSVEPDGFVSAERRFPQGGAGDPVVTASTRHVDLEAGTVRLTETVEASPGVPAVTSTSLAELLHGSPVEMVDPLGNRSTMEYDAVGRETRRTDAAGRSVETRYEERAEVVTAPNGVVETERVDALGRVIEISDNIADGRPVDGIRRVAETREYPDPATVVVTDAWGASTRSERDVFGRVVRVVSPTGVSQVHEYDAVANTETSGMTTTGSLADAEATSTRVLDEAGQPVEQRLDRADREAPLTTTASFDGFGRQIAGADDVASSAVEFDALGNAVSTTTTPAAGPADAADPAEPVYRVEREFDRFGQSVQKTVSDGLDQRSGGERELDARGRTVARVDQDGERTTWEYTPDGLLAREETAYGRITEHEYHPQTRALVRTRTESPIGATVEVAYEHDPTTGAVTATFDPRDREATEIAYEHDAWGNLLSTTYPTGKRVSHRYDEHGRRVASTDVVGSTTAFMYTGAGLLASARKTAPGCDAGCDPVASVDYLHDEFGRVVTLERGNGATTHYEFSALDEVTAERTTDAAGELVVERRYEHDARGNTVRRTETARGDRDDGGTGEPAVESIEYAYDHLDRLITSLVRAGLDEHAPITRQTEYVPTAGGDLASERVLTDPGTDAEHQTIREYTYDATGELRTITTDGAAVEQVYDAAGNLVLGADGTAFTYNARNQVVEERVGDGRTQVAYWADGARRSLTAPVEGAGADAATEFYWDGADLVNDLHAADTADGDWDTAGYLLGAGRHARVIDDASADNEAQAQAAYYVSDPLGSTTHLLGDDGSAVEAYAYTDYGAARSDAVGAAATAQHADRAVGDVTRNPMRFAGELTDDSGRQYLRARMYDPATARFISEDEAPQFTRYAYADLNPVRLADPSGRTPTEVVSWTVIGVGVLAAFIGVASVLATVATGGVITLGVPGIGAAVLGGLADAYSLFVATGQILSNMRPEWVDDDLEAFFQSDEAVWSEALVGGALVGAAILAKAGYEAIQYLPVIKRVKAETVRDFAGAADQVGGQVVDTMLVRERVKIALAVGGKKVLDHLDQTWVGKKTETSQILTLGRMEEGLEAGLRDYARAEWISRGLALGGVSMDDLLLPMKRELRARLARAFPNYYGEKNYLPRVTFKSSQREYVWVDDDVLGTANGWGVEAPPPPAPVPHVEPEIIFGAKDGKPGRPAGEY